MNRDKPDIPVHTDVVSTPVGSKRTGITVEEVLLWEAT